MNKEITPLDIENITDWWLETDDLESLLEELQVSPAEVLQAAFEAGLLDTDLLKAYKQELV